MKIVWLGLIILLLSVGCDDSADNKNNNAVITEVQNTAASGQWKITYYVDAGSNETNNFTGYEFDFTSDKSMLATSGSNQYTGSWSVTDNDSGDDSSNGHFDDIDFNISFATPPGLEELSEDWEILSLTDTKLELRHISGGNGGSSFLTFEKS